MACALLAAFSRRLRGVGWPVPGCGVVLAVAAALPGAVTLAIAAVADPAHPQLSGRLNRLEPRADDVLFAAVVLFAGSVVLARRLVPGWVRAVAATTVAFCLARLAVEAFGRQQSWLDSSAAITFLLLIAALSAMLLLGSVARPAAERFRGDSP